MAGTLLTKGTLAVGEKLQSHAAELPSTKVGTHHRVRHTDIAALRQEREAARDAAAQRLLELDD